MRQNKHSFDFKPKSTKAIFKPNPNSKKAKSKKQKAKRQKAKKPKTRMLVKNTFDECFASPPPPPPCLNASSVQVQVQVKPGTPSMHMDDFVRITQKRSFHVVTRDGKVMLTIPHTTWHEHIAAITAEVNTMGFHKSVVTKCAEDVAQFNDFWQTRLHLAFAPMKSNGHSELQPPLRRPHKNSSGAHFNSSALTPSPFSNAEAEVKVLRETPMHRVPGVQRTKLSKKNAALQAYVESISKPSHVSATHLPTATDLHALSSSPVPLFVNSSTSTPCAFKTESDSASSITPCSPSQSFILKQQGLLSSTPLQNSLDSELAPSYISAPCWTHANDNCAAKQLFGESNAPSDQNLGTSAYIKRKYTRRSVKRERPLDAAACEKAFANNVALKKQRKRRTPTAFSSLLEAARQQDSDCLFKTNGSEKSCVPYGAHDEAWGQSAETEEGAASCKHFENVHDENKNNKNHDDADAQSAAILTQLADLEFEPL